MDNSFDSIDCNSIVKYELFYGICQCCLAEGDLNSILESFSYNDNIEVYSDVLNKCFSIEVQNDDKNLESLYLICNSCVEKLKQSFAFRLQIEKSQIWLKEVKSSTLQKCTYLDDSPKEEDSEEYLCDETFSDSDPMFEKKQNKRAAIKITKVQKTKNKPKGKLKIVRRNIPQKIFYDFPKSDIEKMTKEEYLKLYNRYYHLELLPFKINKNDRSCHICSEKFRFHKGLLDHMRIHFPNFICDSCGKSFVTKKNLEKHKQRHADEKVACEICDKILKKSSLLDHMRRHSGTNAKNKCTECSEYFANYYKRQDHMESVHGIAKPKYDCKLCSKLFATNSALYRHVRSFHSQERNFTCSECDKSFYSIQRLKDHSIVHSKVKNFSCDVCFKAFGRKNSLRQHLKIHSSVKEHQCSICGREFTQKCSLIGHMKVHSIP